MSDLENRVELIARKEEIQGPETQEYRDSLQIQRINVFQYRHERALDNRLYLVHDDNRIVWFDETEATYNTVDLRGYIDNIVGKTQCEELFSNRKKITGLSVDRSGVYFSVGDESIHRIDLDAKDNSSAKEIFSVKKQKDQGEDIKGSIWFFEVLDGKMYLGFNTAQTKEPNTKLEDQIVTHLRIIGVDGNSELYKNPQLDNALPVPIRAIPKKSGEYLVVGSGDQHIRLVNDGKISRLIKVNNLSTNLRDYYISGDTMYINDGGIIIRYAPINTQEAFDFSDVENIKLSKVILETRSVPESVIRSSKAIGERYMINESFAVNDKYLFVRQRPFQDSANNRIVILDGGMHVGTVEKGTEFNLLAATNHAVYARRGTNTFKVYDIKK